MPQFDIASFYPQIVIFTAIFLIFYIFLTKQILPKLCQNLKLTKKLLNLFGTFATDALKDLNFLSYIYNPSRIVSHLIYKETLSLVFLEKFLQILTLSYLSSIHWLFKTNEKALKIGLLKINKIYLGILKDTYSLDTNK